MTSNKYITSLEFINKLTFDYVETYSFQRGSEFEEKRKLIKDEYENLKVRKEKRNNLSSDEEVRFEELFKLLAGTQYIINDEGKFHPSSKKVNTFKNENQNIERIKNILQTEIAEIPSWMCAPIYRDAIVFYDSEKKITDTLNVCLSCQYMETKINNHINGDNKTYDLLKQFFIDIGHNVENDN